MGAPKGNKNAVGNKRAPMRNGNRLFAMTQEEVSKHLNISRAGVAFIEKKALGKIRAEMRLIAAEKKARTAIGISPLPVQTQLDC